VRPTRPAADFSPLASPVFVIGWVKPAFPVTSCLERALVRQSREGAVAPQATAARAKAASAWFATIRSPKGRRISL
jgi:hypothetical protein